MSENLEIVFLGTGTSHGVPMIGCDCRVCRSDDPRDKRNRTSVALRRADGRTILIDCPPELRLAAVANHIDRVDGLLLTHHHADHILGMDDMRRYNNILGQAIPVLGQAETIEHVRTVFAYAAGPYIHPDRPSFDFHVVDGPFTLAGLDITPVPLIHGRIGVLGFRIGRFAYCTDVSTIPESSYDLLTGLDLLVLDALRYTPHPAHFNLDQALAAIQRIRPSRTLLTHIAHEIHHATTQAGLPAGVELARDNLAVSVDI